jgi:hypothetical protein
MKKFIASLLVLSIFTISAQAPTQEDKEISIKMKLSQWNVVLKALRELPYKESGDPIGEIMYQADQQLKPVPVKTQSKPDTTKKKQ